MELLDLVKVPDQQRDVQWENQFFVKLTEGKVRVMTPDPQEGPDKWPYLMVETTPTAEEPVQSILHWLYTKGIGLVVNPMREYPDYVFTYGMIWHFRETGLFYRTADQAPVGTFEVQEGQSLHAGDADPSYLPKYVRSIIKEFLRDQGVLSPRILVMSQDRKNYDLAFSIESLGNPPQKEHEGIAEALSWFLPPHYTIALVSEKGLPKFYEL